MAGSAIRTLITTSAVLLTFVAIAIGAADRGETTEQTQDERCKSAVWPMIPATCFGGQDARDVYPRKASLDTDELILAAQQRNDLSPQAPSKKADRLEAVEIGSAEYRTVEIRTDAGSILTRIRIEE